MTSSNTLANRCCGKLWKLLACLHHHANSTQVLPRAANAGRRISNLRQPNIRNVLQIFLEIFPRDLKEGATVRISRVGRKRIEGWITGAKCRTLLYFSYAVWFGQHFVLSFSFLFLCSFPFLKKNIRPVLPPVCPSAHTKKTSVPSPLRTSRVSRKIIEGWITGAK